ncbi:MAG: peptidase dimerization domain protein [Firmicutes bacterium]|nr:peptidase dimerization domain protein [Bacillota bacterium]
MKQVLEAIEAKKTMMLDFLETLVNIDSGFDNPEGLHQCAEIIGNKLSSLGFEVEYIRVPDVCTHVLAQKKGKTSKSILLTGHIDTVFLRGTAAARPFMLKDGRAFGPGVADMKGGIVTGLFALEALGEHGYLDDKNVTVLFCGDEETGHPKSNVAEIYEREGQGKDAIFCLEPGRPNGEVVVGRKGIINPSITVKGKAAHAGVDPEKGASAIMELANKICDLQKLTNFEKGILCNVGMIGGGTGPAVIPDNAYAKLNIRVNEMDDGEQMLRAVREIVAKQYVPGTETTLLDDYFVYPPFVTTEEVRHLLTIVQEQGRKLGLQEIEGIFTGGGSDVAWATITGSPAIDGMGATGGSMHNDAEWMSVQGLFDRAKLLALSINAI